MDEVMDADEQMVEPGTGEWDHEATEDADDRDDPDTMEGEDA